MKINKKIIIPATITLAVAVLFGIGAFELSHKEYEATLSYNFASELAPESVVSEVYVADARVSDFRNNLLQVNNKALLGRETGDIHIQTFCGGKRVDSDLQKLNTDELYSTGKLQVTINNLPFGKSCRTVIKPEFGDNKTVAFTASPLHIPSTTGGERQ